MLSMIYHNISKNSTYEGQHIYFPLHVTTFYCSVGLLFRQGTCTSWNRYIFLIYNLNLAGNVIFFYFSDSHVKRAFKQCTKACNYLQLLDWSYKTLVPVKFKLFSANFCVLCSDENESTLLLVASYLPLSCQFIR